jgi:hypothetical protein
MDTGIANTGGAKLPELFDEVIATYQDDYNKSS